MGHTGAGKSTILKLVEKFYQPQSGAVKINGKEISEFTIKSIRSRFGFRAKTPSYFLEQFGKNVAYAREVSDEEVISSLKTAGAWEFVSELEEGMDSMVGDKQGVRLSEDRELELALPEPS